MSYEQGLAVKPERTTAPGKSVRTRWVAASIFSSVLILLPWLFKLDGKPHADWQQFLGRFHPLAVHLPIGFLLLVPVFEIAALRRPALRESAGLVLILAFLASLGSLTLGYLLAYGSGEAGSTVTWHMWGGIALTIGVLFSLLARASWSSGTPLSPYPFLLTGTILTLFFTAHEGGSITHGSGYLFQFMPTAFKRLAPSKDAQASTSFYAKQIHPIFDANCVSCHGESKTSGGLRLDSYEQLIRGGKAGPAILPGDPDKSLLLHRVTLPTNHPQFMPAEGKPPLTSLQISYIRAWIKQGASPTDANVQGLSIPGQPQDFAIVPVGDYSRLIPEIEMINKGQGAKLMPVSSKPSDGLVLYTVDAADSFGDEQLTQFEKYAPYIVELELGRTAVTDASFATFAKFTHLRALHLEGTSVSGQGVASLAPLTQLTYLNLSGTELTRASTDQLSSLKSLRHVYLSNTPAQP